MKGTLRSAIILATLAVLVLPAILLYPLNMDNDVLQSQGLELFRHVGLPYLGSWDENFPGTVFLHWTAISLFGAHSIGFRFFEYLWQIVTMVVLYKVSRLWLGRRTALFGAAAFAIFYVHGPLTLMGQRDGFVTLPILFAILILLGLSRARISPFQRLGLVAAGILFGVAAAIRPTYALLLPIAPFTLWSIKSKLGREAFVLLFGGALVVAIGIFTVYAFQPHGIEEAFLAMIRFNLDVYSHIPAEKVSGRIFFASGIILAWAGFGVMHKWNGLRFLEAPHRSNERRFLTFSVLAILAGIIVQRKFFSYHYISFFALCMPAVAVIGREYWLRVGRWGQMAATVLLCVIAFMLYPRNMVLHFVRSGFLLPSTYEYILPDPIYGYRAQKAVADYVDEKTVPSDRVEFASFFPGPRWHIDRFEATRFTTVAPLLSQTPDGDYTPYQIRWRAEFVDQLQSLKPEYIIIQEIPDPAHTTSERFTPVFARMFKIPGLSELLESQYHKDTTFDSCTFYRRNRP